MAPLRILGILPNPADLPRFDDAGVWRQITEALAPMCAAGSVVAERLAHPTEEALKKCLAQGGHHVLHFVVHARERLAARYGTVALESSDGHARNLTAAYLARLFAGNSQVRLIVLQACAEADFCFDTVSDALAEQGMTVLLAPALNGRPLAVLAAKLYAGLAAGLGPEAAHRDVAAALAASGLDAKLVRLAGRNAQAPVLSATAAAAVVEAPPPAAAPIPQPDWRRELERKRAAGEFDVFLCHNWADKPAVKRIAERLKENGVLPWLDAWELPPGQPWQPLLEQQIGAIRSAAVFVGAAGLGPWQEQEMYGFLREFVERRAPVIPVLLPDAPAKPELPRFLRGMTWVDFRTDDPDPLEMLLWGITGKRPGE